MTSLVLSAAVVSAVAHPARPSLSATDQAILLGPNCKYPKFNQGLETFQDFYKNTVSKVQNALLNIKVKLKSLDNQTC